MSISLPLGIPKKATLIFIIFIFFVIGCQSPANQPTVATAVSTDRFTYQIRIQETSTDQPIEDANVTINLPGTPPVNDFTDSTGLAVFLIDDQFVNALVVVQVTRNGYKDWEQYITLKTGEHPQEMKLQLAQAATSMVASETATAVSTDTPQPTAAEATDTAVLPTNTVPPAPTTTPTHTPSPTATNTPAPVGQIIAQVTETAQDTWVYTGPGNANLRLGSMRTGETGVVLGKDKWNGWYKIRTGDNLEGWVDITHLTITQGSPGDVAVVWPPSNDETGVETTELPSGGGSSNRCATVKLDFKEWPNEKFDDITVSWSNVPANTAYFIFAANGTLNGEEAPLIYPTQVNVEEKYLIGLWKFAERGFTTGGTFSYALQAKTNSGTTICTTTGTFTQ